MKKKIIAILVCLLSLTVLFSFPARAAAGNAADTENAAMAEKIENYYKETWRGSGLSVAVFNAEEELYKGYFGFQNKEKNIEANEDTVMDWGSISKLLIWVSAMQLNEQGKLGLNDDLRPYFPEAVSKKLQYDEPITMLHLMNHTAGFEEAFQYMGCDSPEKLLSFEDYLIKAQPRQVFGPGSTVAYSNYGAGLAAYVVEKISRENYANYAHKHIFAPLGMENTAIRADYSDNENVKRRYLELATISKDGNQMRRSSTESSRYISNYPAGACVSTLTDLEIFARALLIEDERLMKEETFELFFSPSRTYTGSERARNRHGMWERYDYAVPMTGHNGAKTTSALLLLDRANGKGIVIQTNTALDTSALNDVPALIFGEAEKGQPASPVFAYAARGCFRGIFRVMIFALPGKISPQLFPKSAVQILPDRWEIDASDQILMKGADWVLFAVFWLWAAGVIYCVVLLIVILFKTIRRRLKKADGPLKTARDKWFLLSAVTVALAVPGALISFLVSVRACSVFAFAAIILTFFCIAAAVPVFIKTRSEKKRLALHISVLVMLVLAATALLVYQIPAFWLV